MAVQMKRPPLHAEPDARATALAGTTSDLSQKHLMSTAPQNPRRNNIKAVYAIADDWKKASREINIQSIAFFIATTGCWSVPAGKLRWYAFAAVIVYFGYSVAVGVRGVRSREFEFDKLDKEEIRKDESAWPLYQAMDDEHTGVRGMLRHNLPYAIAVMFWLLSVAKYAFRS